jgi:hypothetical protein
MLRKGKKVKEAAIIFLLAGEKKGVGGGCSEPERRDSYVQ